MKIKSIHIYGFGKWVDQSFDFSNQTLTCLYGENEAGKSTLQQFMLFMLFGFPPKMRNFYKPKQSNRIGGTMKITDSTIGTYTIERVEASIKCFLPTGEIEGEEWLRTHLNGLTKEIYLSIYSFSALDLSEIRQMQADDLSEVLFSVGLTGATSIYEVEKQLDKEIGDLFKKSGRIPLINEQLTKVSKLQQKLQADKALETSYEEKVSQKKALATQIEHTQNRLRATKEKLLELEKMKQLIPVLKQYQLVEERLQLFPENIFFPEDGISRYESLKENLLPLKSEWHILDQTMKELEVKINNLSENLYREENVKHAQELVKQYSTVQVRAEKIKALEKELNQVDHSLASLLQSTHLLEEQLDDITFPFHVEKSWQALSEANDQLQLESEKLTDDHQVITEETDRLEKEAKEIEEQLLSRKEIQHIEERVAGFHLQKVQEQWNSMQEKRHKQSQAILWTSSLLAVITFLVAMFLENNALFIIPVVLILVGVGQLFLTKISTDDIDRVSIEKGFMISKEERESLERQLAKQRELEAGLQVIKAEQQRLHFQQLQLEERKSIFVQKENKWMNQIEQEIQQYPFLQHAEPTYWVEFFQTVQEMKQLLTEKRQIKEQIQVIQQEQIDFQDQLNTLATHLQIAPPISIEHVENRLEQYRSDVQLMDQYKEMLHNNDDKQKELTSQITLYEAEMNELFKNAQVHHEEQYFQKANQLKEKNELLKQKDHLVQQLLVSIPEVTIEKALKEAKNENEISVDILELTDDMETLENELANKNKQLATLKLEISQLESSEEISRTAYLYEMEKDKLNELAKRWAVLKSAQTALSKAKKSYQETYLQEVIHYTSTYFKQLTKGKYIRVFAPTETELFQVDANNDIRYTVNELSQGTIDQLYVSLRLAIGKVMSDKFIVPFIIDDAFVHFDEERTKEIIQLLKKIASEQQILLFTCKQNIADQFEHPAKKTLMVV